MKGHKLLIEVRLALLFFVLEILCVLIGNGIGLLTEESPFSKRVATLMNHWTQSTMAKRQTDEVVVVDLTGMKRVPSRYQYKDHVLPTSRQQLFELVERLQSFAPTAIGIDIDFSMEWVGKKGDVDYALDGTDGDPRESDPLFFDRLLELHADHPGTTIALGSYRQAQSDPSIWFSKSPRQDLAALGATIPVFADSCDLVPVSHKAPEQVAWVPTMALSLASAARLALPEKPTWLPDSLTKFVENRMTTVEPDQLGFHSVIVDYSAVDSIVTIPWTSVMDSGTNGMKGRLQDLFNGHVVLCGYGQVSHLKPEEVFPIPVRPWRVPGVLVHAASVDTLTGTGLFTLTSKGKLVSELSLFGLLALIGLVIEVAAIKKCSRLDEEETAIQEFQLARSILWMNGCATALLFLVFTMGVQYLRLLWMDLFVILGLHWILYFVLSSIRSRSRQSHGSMSSVVPENGADAC